MYYNKKHSVGPTLKKKDKVYLLKKNIKTKRPSNKLNYKKLRLFKIDKKVRTVFYRLFLPKTINIYLVFYISLLELTLVEAPPTLIIEI